MGWSPSLPTSAKTLTYVLIGFFLVLGTVHSVVLPPFQVPDEPAHWLSGLNRAHQLLGGVPPLCSRSMAMTEIFPARNGVYNGQFKFDPRLIERAEAAPPKCGSIHIGYGGYASYPGVLLSHLISRLVPEMSAVLQFRLARFFSGLLIVAALWASAGVAFRAHSDSKNPLPLFALWGVLLLLCSPIGLQQSFGVSSDVPVFAFGILLASLLASGQHWNVSIWALFVPTAWSAFQTKPVLAPLLIPILMSPRLGPRLILTGLFSYGIISGLFTRALSSAGNGGDTALQKAHILENPLTSLAVILGATLKKAVFYSHWMFGTLGWFDHSPSHLTIVLLFGGLIGLWIQFATKARWSETPRQATLQDAIFMASWLGSASLITLALYLTWTVPGSDRVTGVQGRYFLAHQMVIFGYLAHRLRPAGEMDRRAPGLLLGTCASLLILRLFETWSHYH